MWPAFLYCSSAFSYLESLSTFSINLRQVRSLRVKEQEVFLDSDNLTDLRQLLVHIADSDCIALLHTEVR